MNLFNLLHQVSFMEKIQPDYISFKRLVNDICVPLEVFDGAWKELISLWNDSETFFVL